MICRHCKRSIVKIDGTWTDPEATNDDAVWSEVCDMNDSFAADHEPIEGAELEKALEDLLDFVTSGRRYETRNPYLIPEVDAAYKALGRDWRGQA